MYDETRNTAENVFSLYKANHFLWFWWGWSYYNVDLSWADNVELFFSLSGEDTISIWYTGAVTTWEMLHRESEQELFTMFGLVFNETFSDSPEDLIGRNSRAFSSFSLRPGYGREEPGFYLSWESTFTILFDGEVISTNPKIFLWLWWDRSKALFYTDREKVFVWKESYEWEGERSVKLIEYDADDVWIDGFQLVDRWRSDYDPMFSIASKWFFINEKFIPWEPPFRKFDTFYADKNFVYNEEWERQEWVNGETFEEIMYIDDEWEKTGSFFYFTDWKSIYYGYRGSDSLQKVTDDVDAFYVSSDQFDTTVWFDSSHVYIRWEMLSWADPDTFESLNPWYYNWTGPYNNWYWKDASQAYITCDEESSHYICVIPYADWSSFELLRHPVLSEKNVDKYWWRSNTIYWYWSAVNWFTKDKDNVFYKQDIVVWADPLTFVPIWSYYFLDKKYVYYFDWYTPLKLSWVDVDTFEVIDATRWVWINGWDLVNDVYARDKNSLLYKWTIIQWASPNDLTKINEHEFYISNEKVIHKWRIISDAIKADLSQENYIEYTSEVVPEKPDENELQTWSIDSNDNWLEPEFSLPSFWWTSVIKNHGYYITDTHIYTTHWKKIEFLDTNSLQWYNTWLTDGHMLYIKNYDSQSWFAQFTDYWSTFEIHFLPEYAQKVNSYMKDIFAKKMVKDELQKLFSGYSSKRPEDYMEWSLEEVVMWTLVSHILENIDMYYE